MFSATGASRSSAGSRSTRAASAAARSQRLLHHRAEPVGAVARKASSRPSAPGSRATGRGRGRRARCRRRPGRAARAADRPPRRRTSPAGGRRRAPRCSRRRTAPAPICGNRTRRNPRARCPASSGRSAGASIAIAPKAPSTWNHRPFPRGDIRQRRPGRRSRRYPPCRRCRRPGTAAARAPGRARCARASASMPHPAGCVERDHAQRVAAKSGHVHRPRQAAMRGGRGVGDQTGCRRRRRAAPPGPARRCAPPARRSGWRSRCR